MRTIKFRGWNRKNKQWLYGFYLQNRGAHFVCPDEFAYSKSWEDYGVEAETVGQFTGLHDKNGKEIYERDIILIHDTGVLRIDWNNERTCFDLIESGGSFFHGLWAYYQDGYEVLGNIHDNPEMLKHR